MFKDLKSYLQYGLFFLGVEHAKMDDEHIIIATVLKRKKKEILIEDHYNANTIDGLAEAVGKKIRHAFLVINNEFVLTKKLESNYQDINRLANQAFPNINLDEFYLEHLYQEHFHFISICRKDYANKLIQDYKRKGIYIINVSFGNTLANTIKEFINADEIMTSNALVTFKDEKLLSISKLDHLASRNYNINGLLLTNQNLLSATVALQTIIGNYSTHSNFDTKKELLLNEYNEKNFFRTFIKYGLICILGLLLFNFMFFSYYYAKVDDLRQLSQFNLSTKDAVVNLNEEVKKKEKMVDDLLKSDASKSSFFTNAIIQSIPGNSILLSELNYQPLEKRIKKEQPIQLVNNTLIISGLSSNSEMFSNWVSNLEQQSWSKKVDILEYGSNNNNKKFKLKIVINSESTR